eukprot:m.82885 g.82885  ORF g.82885 m.82885 type:complete len:140 (+) comp14636_c0_seq3:1615-2034(+)
MPEINNTIDWAFALFGLAGDVTGFILCIAAFLSTLLFALKADGSISTTHWAAASPLFLALALNLILYIIIAARSIGMSNSGEGRVIRSALATIFFAMGLSFLCAYLDNTGKEDWSLAEALSPMFVGLFLLFSMPQWVKA